MRSFKENTGQMESTAFAKIQLRANADQDESCSFKSRKFSSLCFPFFNISSLLQHVTLMMFMALVVAFQVNYLNNGRYLVWDGWMRRDIHSFLTILTPFLARRIGATPAHFSRRMFQLLSSTITSYLFCFHSASLSLTLYSI